MQACWLRCSLPARDDYTATLELNPVAASGAGSMVEKLILQRCNQEQDN